MNNTTITTTTRKTPQTTTKNPTTINTARTSTFATSSSTKSPKPTTTTFTPYSTDLSTPTHYNGNSTEKIDIAGEIIKQTQQEITSSVLFIPTIGLLFALIPVFLFCLCHARC